MQSHAIDQIARALTRPRPRRQAGLALTAVLLGSTTARAQSGSGTASGEITIEAKIPRSCRHFEISAGPRRGGKFKHIDDDLLIVLIPKGKRGRRRTILFEDDNGEANGDNGKHLKVAPFKARVGDRIQIIAKNAQAGGCELDEIWLHCTEAGGGKKRLSKRITREDCRDDWNRIGVFFNKVVRIRGG
jgi:hypothetical protein